MQDEKLLLLVALHDGAHFIEKPNPVTVLSASSRSARGRASVSRRRLHPDRDAVLGRGAGGRALPAGPRDRDR